MPQTQVLIVGAGPTGLVLALWLSKLGVKLRIIDKLLAPNTTSRALALQARTLELYRQLDLTEAALAHGHEIPAVNLWVQGEAKARVSFAGIAAGVTPYAPLIFPQDEHERLLIARLQELGVAVERDTELLGCEDLGDRVRSRLRGANGAEETCEATYLAACDGARSIVRQSLDIGFPGGTYNQVFYVADVDASGEAINGELHIDLDQADFLGVFPLKGAGHARLIGTIRDVRAEHAETLKFEDVRDDALRNMRIVVNKVNWFSTYRVHHRVTDHFRKGRLFLLGDAAHIHSPAGGQGMNTGIGDAINLAWKLKAVLDNRAPDTLLDSYEAERRAFARKLVATTDKVFTFATAEGRVADLIRTRIVPLVAPNVLKLAAAREYLFGAVSQISIAYHDSALSHGHVGEIRGGDRLPWAKVAGADNFDALVHMDWQVHVYGNASEALRAWCHERDIALRAFDWIETHAQAGFVRDAIYLLRPDTYVALAQESQDTDGLHRYFSERGLH